MLKKKIEYEDFEGEKQEGEFYFNLTTAELVELEVEHKEGLEEWTKRVVGAKDRKTLYAEFKRIVLMAYGEKSPDGQRFIKNPQIREDFSNHAAFHELVVELSSDADSAASFVKGIMPKDLASKAEKDIEKLKAEVTSSTE